MEGTPPLVESTTAQASVHLGAQKILRLPRLSAGLDRLALLAPGVSQTFGNLAENGAMFSANGQRPRSNGFLLDGQDNSHRIPGGPRFLFGVRSKPFPNTTSSPTSSAPSMDSPRAPSST